VTFFGTWCIFVTWLCEKNSSC